MSGILSLNQLIADRVREHPDLQILGIPDKNFTPASLLANHLKDTGALPGRARGDATSRLTVGLLGVSNIDYVVTEMALYRMGYCILFLSPNNSPPAIAHLLTVTNASHVVVQHAFLASATAALSHLADPSSVSIVLPTSYPTYSVLMRAPHTQTRPTGTHLSGPTSSSSSPSPSSTRAVPPASQSPSSRPTRPPSETAR
ncbi:hypothetical protein J3R83DRAFT_4053 [Lanmaoa asiatica]|nr:hypothetical protein J3R83DRAFT_4053 [Lanmaoa asiatica]